MIKKLSRDYIIEGKIFKAGDEIEILEESKIQENYSYYLKEFMVNAPVDQYGVNMKVGQSKYVPVNKESIMALQTFYDQEF